MSPLRCDTASCAGCGVQLNASLPIENRMHGLFSFKPMFIVNVESLYMSNVVILGVSSSSTLRLQQSSFT
ncbi:hypothetical protein HMPREF3231_01942 [Bifidobacterium longum]|nr:hypothetical protein HMPREF3231_01942 [Bifidobacterium longum]